MSENATNVLINRVTTDLHQQIAGLREQLGDRDQDVKILRSEIEADKVRIREALEWRDRAEDLATRMADTLRAVLVAVDEYDKPYPWDGGALKQQIREDITAYELLNLDGEPA